MPEQLCDATIEDGRGRLLNCQLLDGHAGRHYSALHHGHDVMHWTDEAFTAKPASSTPPEPSVRVTRYTVSCVPRELVPDAHLWALTVEERRDGRWVVSNGSEWLDAECEWHVGCGAVYERCAHDFETAMGIAKAVAPHMLVMGRTPEMVVAEVASRGE